MSSLSERKIEIVRMLVETAPDAVVAGLHRALSSVDGDSALARVRDLVATEMCDREARNAVLSPVAPLFGGVRRDPVRLALPARALSMIWRALKTEAPDEVRAAKEFLEVFKPGESPSDLLDNLTIRAAQGLRALEREDYRAIALVLDDARPGGAAVVVSCLAVAPVVRVAALRLPDWIMRMTEERAAAARLAYKDAVDLNDESGPLFFAMLGAQLPEPWCILRVISAVMDRPAERYMSSSELAGFALEVLDDIDRNLAHVARFDLNGGAAAGRDGATKVEVVTRQIAEMEHCVELSKEGPWGGRLQKQKQALARVVEGRLAELDKTLLHALPQEQVKSGRGAKLQPRLSQEPDMTAANRAVSLLTFVEAIRSSANYGGFASTRGKCIEKVAESLGVYVEEALALIREALVADPDMAGRHLEVAAELTTLVHDTRAGEIVRRRTAVALGMAKTEDAAPLAATGT